jgi:hypothetical protein
MKLFELEDNDILTGYYDPAEDEMNVRRPTDVRKPLLTLKHLNRLKKMRALKKLEDLKRQDLLGIIYAPPEPPAGGSPF